MFSELLNSLLYVVEVLLRLGVPLLSLSLQLLHVHFRLIDALLCMPVCEHYLIQLRVRLPDYAIPPPVLLIQYPLQLRIDLVPLIPVLIINHLYLRPQSYRVCAHLLHLVLHLQLLPHQPLYLSVLLLPLEHLFACDSVSEPCLLLQESIERVVLLLNFVIEEDVMEAICLLLALLLEGLAPVDTLHARQVLLVLVQARREHRL
jgi:hypothetical protein